MAVRYGLLDIFDFANIFYWKLEPIYGITDIQTIVRALFAYGNGDSMELKLKGYGTIEITSATLVDGGDIRIESADGFEVIQKTTDYKVTEAYLTKTDDYWDVVAWLNVPDDDWYTQRTIIAEIENEEDVYKLNAFL